MPGVERTSIFPAVFLDDAVAHGEAQAGAAAGRLGGEEGIEDAVDMFARDAGTGIGDFDFDAAVVRARCALPPCRRQGMASRAFMKRIQEDLLQTLLLEPQHCAAVSPLQIASPPESCAGPERMRDQRKRFFDNAVQVSLSANSGGAGAREIQQVVDDFAGAERLLDDFSINWLPRIAVGQLLRQHLDVVEITASGVFTSCATPAASRPSEVSFLGLGPVCSSMRIALRTSSNSRSAARCARRIFRPAA